VAAVGGLNKFKMAAVAMVTKVQKMLNSLPTSQSFACKAIPDITPPHHFGTSVSMVTPF
jgi:hypothetical protein